MFDVLRSLFSPDDSPAPAPWYGPLLSQAASGVTTIYAAFLSRQQFDAHSERLRQIDSSILHLNEARKTTRRDVYIMQQALGINPSAPGSLAAAADAGDLEAVRKWLDACAPAAKVATSDPSGGNPAQALRMLADIECAANAGNLDGIRDLFARAHALCAAEKK